jgi:phage terminase large subunit-like protein
VAKPKKQQGTAFKLLSEGLRAAAVRPTIYAYSAHPKQVTFHKSPAKGRQFLGGNRSGKTVAGCVEAVYRARGEHPYLDVHPAPTRGRSVAVDFTYGTSQIVIPELKKWIPPSMLINGSWSDSYNGETRELTFENGSTIEFRSYDQDLEKFAGVSRHWTWFDEEPPHGIFKESLMRLIDTRGVWWMTMTPVEGMTWTYKNIYQKRFTDPAIFVVEVEMDENPYLPHEEKEEYLSMLDENDLLARKQGRYIEIAGVIWPQFGKHNIIDPWIPTPREDYLFFNMMDHGFNNPTAWLWGAVDRDGRTFIYHEHYRSGQIVEWHASRVISLNKELEVSPSYYVGDPSIAATDPITGTSIQIEYMENGIPILLGNNDVKAGIGRVARYLKNRDSGPQLYIARNCVKTLEEVPAYRWAQWATRKMREDRNPKEEPHKKDDHSCDALRYGIASRPEMDSGQAVPDGELPILTPKSVDVYHRVDEGLQSMRNSSGRLDWHMGEDF